MEGTLKNVLKRLILVHSVKQRMLLRSGTIKPQRGVIDDKRVSDHHAIIPTEETPIYQKLSDREQRLYELIVNRFLAVFFGPFATIK